MSIMTVQGYVLGQDRSFAHISLLRYVRQRMADAVIASLATSAQMYADCLASYQKHPPELLGSAQPFGGVREVFAGGAFLRVSAQERSIVDARKREEEQRKASARARSKSKRLTVASEVSAAATDMSVATTTVTEQHHVHGALDDTLGAIQEQESGNDSHHGTDSNRSSSSQQQQHVASETSAGGVSCGHPPGQNDSDRTYIVLVPGPEDIADVAAGLLGDMFDSVAELKVRKRAFHTPCRR